MDPLMFFSFVSLSLNFVLGCVVVSIYHQAKKHKIRLSQNNTSVNAMPAAAKTSGINPNSSPSKTTSTYRTGPAGKKAQVSDAAVASISEKADKEMRKAIKIIGRGRGF